MFSKILCSKLVYAPRRHEVILNNKTNIRVLNLVEIHHIQQNKVFTLSFARYVFEKYFVT